MQEEEKQQEEQEAQPVTQEQPIEVADIEQEQLPWKEQAGRYREALEQALAVQKKDLPPYVLSLLEKLDPLEQAVYLSENQSVLQQAGLSAVPASPQARERGMGEHDPEEARRGQSVLYSNF